MYVMGLINHENNLNLVFSSTLRSPLSDSIKMLPVIQFLKSNVTNKAIAVIIKESLQAEERPIKAALHQHKLCVQLPFSC